MLSHGRRRFRVVRIYTYNGAAARVPSVHYTYYYKSREGFLELGRSLRARARGTASTGLYEPRPVGIHII